MIKFRDLQFKHSDPPDASIHPPLGNMQMLPFRIGRYDEIAMKASHDFCKIWVGVTGEDGEDVALRSVSSRAGGFITCVFPEALPDRIELITRFCEFGFHWDDLTENLDAKLTNEVTQDLALAAISELKQGKRIEARQQINQIGMQIVREMIDKDLRLGLEMIEIWKDHLEHQSTSTHNDMSFPQYLEHRKGEIGLTWNMSLLRWCCDINVSEEEIRSVEHVFEPGFCFVTVMNDYDSFNKEFDQHAKSGTLHKQQNAIAILMREYGYTEAESREIARQEIRRTAGELMDRYNAWEAGTFPKSTELRRYVAAMILVFGGSQYWGSYCSRYHRTDLSTTVEDRAKIVGKGHHGLRVLDGFSAPATPTPGKVLALENNDGVASKIGEA